MLTRNTGLSGPGLLGDARDAVELVVVASAYEAMAELLARAAAALVIDLGSMRPRHARLVATARMTGVEVLGVGSFPPGITSEDLDGVRLVGRQTLPSVLADVLSGAEAVEAPAESLGRYVPARPAGAGTAGSPAAAAAADAAIPQSPTDLLTPDELASLLEDDA